jgi:uncharacterized phage protein (TIGR01671 family)
MNREIKFRGILTHTNEWIYGSYMFHSYKPKEEMKHTILDNRGRQYHVFDKTVCQFTGLHDANGVDIYEGDICDNGIGGKTHIGFKNGGFYYVTQYAKNSKDQDHIVYFGGHSALEAILNRFKIIGNIFQNLELLSGAE